MKRRSAPAADADLDPRQLFAGLTPARGLVLAVSGGPDSTALMVLASAWRQRPPVLVVCVDHGLRPEGSREAEQVLVNAAALGLEARAIRAPAWGGSGNLQDWARGARYSCLVEAARAFGGDTIVTAHHRDDQAETFLLRLKRGSGVYGLAAIPRESFVEGFRLARPLLGVARERLAAIAARSGLAIADDPSNRDLRFDRVAMRRLAPVLAEQGLTSARLAGTAERLGRAAAALDHYAGALIADNFSVSRLGGIDGELAPLLGAPEEVMLRALARLIRAAGGGEHTPRLDRLEALLGDLQGLPAGGRLKRTLGGAIVEAADGRLALVREFGRAGPPTIAVAAGANVVWDNRFRVEVPALGGGLSIGPLGHLAQSAGGGTTLPGLFSPAGLVALPKDADVPEGSGEIAHLQIECLVGGRLAACRKGSAR